MKKLIARTVITLAVLSLASAGALAGGKKGSIKLREDVQIGGVTVEAGSYDVVFDKESGELSIMKGRKVVAKTKAHTEQAASKARTTTFTVAGEKDSRVLRSLTFGGDRQVIVLGETGGGAVTGGTQ